MSLCPFSLPLVYPILHGDLRKHTVTEGKAPESLPLTLRLLTPLHCLSCATTRTCCFSPWHFCLQRAPSFPALYHACNFFLSCFYSCPPSSFLAYDMPSQTFYILSWGLHRCCPCLDLSHFPCTCSVLWLLYLSATFIILSQMSYTLDALLEWVLYSNLDKHSLQGCSPGCVLSNCISTGLLLLQPVWLWFPVFWISSNNTEK